jgi:carboxyl-terminal processing protease
VKLLRNHGRASSAIACALVLAICARAADQPQILTPKASSFESFTRFTELLEALQKNYAQPARIDTGPPTTAALRTFVRSLDPEADLLTPDEAPATNLSTRANDGIGLQFALCGDFPVVIAPRDNSPAQSTGLLAGDQIVAIDGQPILRARRIEVERLLRGPANSPVSLRVLDPASSAVLNVGAQRTAPGSSSVGALKFLDARVAYCRVPEFTVAAVESLGRAMDRAKSQRAAGVVLDLRNNAGGAFEAAQVAASMFLPADETIVSLEYASPSQRTTFVSNPGRKITVPLVVLVNAGTAAEAEVFAAALQDHKRGQLVGSRTFGRGFLAASVALADGSVLSVPTAYYLTPANRVFHGAGLTPDVLVNLPRETERALTRAGFGAFDWANDKTEVLATDAPLAKALSLLAP